MVAAPRILVVDGYTKSARDELQAGGALLAADLYAGMIEQILPAAICDKVFPSDPGAEMPTGGALGDYDGVAWTGCSLTVFEDIPEVRAQLDFARAVFAAGTPQFGSCWAAQIAVVAAGGLVQANPNGREMGIARKIQLTPVGRGHPLYAGKADVFDGFISHVDEITHLPPGAEHLAANAFTRVQAVSVIYGGGTFWGLQYHPEYDLHEMARLTWCRLEKLTELGFFQNREAGEDYVNLLETLHADPARHDIAWLLGVDADVMNRDVRTLEVRNWLMNLVLPVMGARR